MRFAGRAQRGWRFKEVDPRHLWLLHFRGCTPLTMLGSFSPRSAAAAIRATDSRSVRTALTLAEAICDAVMTLGSVRNGLSGGMGSGSQTSMAAAAMWPDWSAAMSAVVSIKSPRDKLRMIAPRLIRAIDSPFSSFRVEGMEGQ